MHTTERKPSKSAAGLDRFTKAKTPAENWGEWERFDEVTGEREVMWMFKSASSPEVRFITHGGQIGAKHAHVAAATCWAYANGYLGVSNNPDDIFLQIAARNEVMAGGVADKHPATA